MARWPTCFDVALVCLLTSLEEVGPRRACVLAKHGIAVARISVVLRRRRPNVMIEQYLEWISIEQEFVLCVDDFARVSRKLPKMQ